MFGHLTLEEIKMLCEFNNRFFDEKLASILNGRLFKNIFL